MDFFSLLKKRHAVRKFKNKEIEPRLLKKLFNAVNSAPSAGNLQAYRAIIVREREKRRLIAEACFSQGFVSTAPVVLVFFADTQRSAEKYSERGKSLYAVQDATIAASYAQLAAAALGMATCWVGAFDEEKIQKILNFSREMKPVAVLPLGFPDEKPFAAQRRPAEDVFVDERIM